MHIRDATDEDWAGIWPLLSRILAAGETYSYDPDMSEEEARAVWTPPPPHRTVVAVDDDGAILGTARFGPNRGGPGAHVGTAAFMVDATRPGRGVGRALGTYVIDRLRAEGYRAIQFNAVVETNTRAVALWTSLGFEVLATVPEAFRHPVHGDVGLLIMYRRLVTTPERVP